MEFTTYTLPNGIRGIHRRIKGNVTHCALLVNAGSRDELKHQFGLAHFTEHALFKGTEHRKAYQVNCRLENLGGELNAFTTKEDTTIHATTLRSDFSKAVELIADVAFHSTFPDRELEKEKEVIYDEINTYKDSPADMIYDTFEDMLFAGSELGHNILGRKSSLARFSGESIREFVTRTHTTDQMVFSSIGNLSAKSVETTVARYLNDIKSSARDFSRRQPAAVEPFTRAVAKHTHQTHCIIGARAQGINDAERLPLAGGARLESPPPAHPAGHDRMALAVCGAHLSGQPLNGQLLARGGRLLQATHSAPRYRLYVLPDGKRPAMVRDEPEGDAIAVEVWEIPSAEVGSLLVAIPAPLGLGQIELADGRWVTGFICEAGGLGAATEITAWGGWRQWLAR